MGATILVPLEEYLSTVYRPDCDFVYGVIEERGPNLQSDLPSSSASASNSLTLP
jgi:hypothetical protein